MALDEESLSFLTQMAERGGKPIQEMEPAEARASGAVLKELYGPGPDMARVVEQTLTGADGGAFELRILVPRDLPFGVIVYYHGGGWVVGDIDQFDTLGRQLAERTGCAVVLVNYRKAPEHRYPIAVEDAWQALNWADENMAAIAGRAGPLIVAGDSAGGNLAAVMAHRARDRSGPAITLQVLVYPVTDAEFDSGSYVDPQNQLMLSRDGMIWFWDHYADQARRAEPDASPLRAGDFTGLPPAIVLVAEHDPQRDEGESYAAALEAAGVPVRRRLFESQMHGFFTMVNLLPGSADGIDYVVAGIRDHLAKAAANREGR